MGFILGGTLIVIFGVIGFQLVRELIQNYHKRVCPACGNRKFDTLPFVHFSMRNGSDEVYSRILCLKCQRVWWYKWPDILGACTEEQTEEVRSKLLQLREQQSKRRSG